MNRESDIQSLCRAVLKRADLLIYNDKGRDYCCFCGAEEDNRGVMHELNCPIWLAKDLSANRDHDATSVAERDNNEKIQRNG